MAVRPIPEGYHTVTPYLIVDDPDRMISCLREAFDADELYRRRPPVERRREQRSSSSSAALPIRIEKRPVGNRPRGVLLAALAEHGAGRRRIR